MADAAGSLPLRDGRIELGPRVVIRKSARAKLTLNEARLLARLAGSPGDVSREELRAAVWPEGPPSARALDHLVARLRKKIEIDPAEPRHLLSAHGVGYRFVSASEVTDVSLPSSAGPFVGRDEELARVEALFEGTRLVSILGGPGIGKTRLAVEHARRAVGRHVTFVDLSGAGSAEELPAALAVALGTSASDLVDAIAAPVPRLVVLDNVEHLLPGAEMQIARWVAIGSHVRWLVTSREALRLQSEARLHLGPLSEDAALQGLAGRAQRLGVEIGEPSAALAEICATLERRPLELELAAGRLPVLGVEGLLSHLATPLSTLRTSSRDVPARHASITDAVGWSWAQLEPAEREALVACASFRAEHSLDAALAVVDRAEGLELIERLLDRSLLERRHHGASPVLHVPALIAEFARAQAGASVHVFDERHARWVLAHAHRTETMTLPLLQELSAIVSRLGAPAHSGLAHSGLAQSGLAQSGLAQSGPLRRLALEAALVIVRVFDSRLSVAERRALLERASEIADSETPDVRIRALLARAELESSAGALEGPLAELDRAAALVTNDGERARVHLSRARVLVHVRPDEALEHARRALELVEQSPDDETQAFALRILGLVARERRENHAARELFQRALLLAEQEGLLRLQGALLVDFANSLLDEGELQQAAQAYRAAIEIDRRRGDEGAEAVPQCDLALVEHLCGDLASARARQERAVEVLRRLGNRRVTGFALAALGALAHEQGDLAIAERRLMEAEQCLDGLHPPFHAYTLALLSAVCSELGDRE
ncbi:MAG: winged helix-turn-helix domain-containing protein, partial [Sandaracinaceae bacterium]|nr:winged helix-turn-helix domain-containing protein [Sandaracinaceae bacterium]